MPSSIPDRRNDDDVGAEHLELDPVALTVALARIDSVNPSLVARAAGEGPIGAFVADWCRSRGLEVHVEEIVPERRNVIAVRRGSGGGRSVILNAHLDTVGASSAATMEVVVETEHPEGPRLVGRGVLDTKGGLAAALVALGRVTDRPLRGDVIVAAVIDEEHGSLGTDALVAGWSADAAIVLEPTSLAVCPRHRGFAVLEVELQGVPSHTSRPDRGINAAHAAAELTRAVMSLDDTWAAAGGPIGERPLTLVDRIETESETFTVPGRSEVTVEVRTSAVAPLAQIDEVRATLDRTISATPGLRGTITTSMVRPPLGVEDDHPLVGTLLRAIGTDAVITSAPFWTDAALHAAADTPAVVFGPTGQGLHEDVEWVSVDSLRRCADALTAFVLDWCE